MPSAQVDLAQAAALDLGAGDERQYSCTPSVPLTVSPTAKAGFFDATTLPMPPARITSPMPTGGM